MFTSDDPGSVYMGLISGTSMDGIDAALVEFGDHQCELHGSLSFPYPRDLRSRLIDATRSPAECTVDMIGDMDRWVGECFRDAAMALLVECAAHPGKIAAIGSHGQTLRHQPRAERPFTLQIGDPNMIATGTGITTVADFRRADMALGGEGAPLMPAFHHWLFADSNSRRAVLNIGGIANVSLLSASPETVVGFDTGPGNTLLDGNARSKLGKAYDASGDWAAGGRVSNELLEAMLADPYFALDAPKSTGFEYFNERWVESKLSESGATELSAEDLQATLSELTARSVGQAIDLVEPPVSEVIVCGGGVHNADLLRRLRICLPDAEIASTASYGLHPDWVEAAGFAWLAMRRLQGKAGNLPAVTGASREELLGSVYMCAS